MLNSQPEGDFWCFEDKDVESRNYGRSFSFDFSAFESGKMMYGKT